MVGGGGSRERRVRRVRGGQPDLPAREFRCSAIALRDHLRARGGSCGRPRAGLPGSRVEDGDQLLGPPERVPFIAVPMGTAMRTLGVDPPPPGTPGPLSRPTPEALRGLLEGGGFSDVEVEQTEVSFTWESADEFVAMVKDTVPPLVALIARHAPDDPDSVWDTILAAAKESASDDGAVTFSNLVLLAVGRA
jgi:hypothetical protein